MSYLAAMAVTVGGQLLGEGAEGGGRIEAGLGVHRERRQPLVDRAGALTEDRDVADQPGRGGEQERVRELVARLIGIGGQRAEQRRVDDKGARGDLEHALDAAAPGPLFDEFEEPFPLELAQVVVEGLPRQPQPRRQVVADSGCCISRRTRMRSGERAVASWLASVRTCTGGIIN